ncbi:MAG TPA: CRISPR system precrRNA processing endoribonuclease RAMP protein Cas6 [Kiritimatiellia bacterium]|nr:CRISPR system precrRNA processing endoribonuclease RAMP protein Cas6 [Kiritimatiellia bacterium]HMO98499.1 CRISPR system precrRNA processing endoribonuclease RAMP protein Cas6 [Kiritimatiellia bacterium]HMP95807.1 CRISPR system precrRNA processing endoribonuclease RAMP protein Cas6 [Kiritimatiellia bacterium]
MDNLPLLSSALHLHAVEGVVYFDRPMWVRRLASATLRGFSGHRLREHFPEVCDTYFKPVAEGKPSACVFLNLDTFAYEGETFQFRIISCAPGLDVITTIQEALDRGRGLPFGNQGALLQYVEWHETIRLAFEGYHGHNPEARIILATPTQLRIAKRTISEYEINLAHIVRACVTRLNALSKAYGNGLQLEEAPYLAESAFARESDRRLRFVTPKRWSSTQDQGINLAGVVGSMRYTGVHPSLTDLLYTANVLHVGRHTSEGCGRVIAIPAREKSYDGLPKDDEW